MREEEHCKQMVGTLSDYMDGELSPEMRQALENHLKDCKDCQVVLNTMKKTIELYKLEEDKKTIPPKVRKRLYARLKLRDLEDPKETPGFFVVPCSSKQ